MSTQNFDLTAAVDAAERAINDGFGVPPIGVIQAAIEAALPHLLAEKDAEVERLRGVVALVDIPDMARIVAKMSWDRGEADYWDYETDHRQFDPTITELDSDQVDRGRDWLGTVTEILTDLRTALDEASR